MIDLLPAAVKLAAAGKPIFPLEPGGKRPLGRLAKHGCHDATTSLDTVRAWWLEAPEANIGMATGDPSGIVVVDLDGTEGLRAWEALLVGRDPVRTLTTETGRGGRHLFFKDPGDGAIRNTAGKLGKCIDTRGTGGYIVVPPSRTENPYRWLNRDPVAPMPAWLLEALEDQPEAEPATRQPDDRDWTYLQPYARKALDNEVESVASAPKGSRNHTLNQAAFNLGQFIAAGALDRHTVEVELGFAAGTAGLSAGEIRKTIISGINAGEKHPREVPEGSHSRSRPNSDITTKNDDEKPEIDAKDGDLARVAEAAWQALIQDNEPVRMVTFAGRPHRIECNDGQPIPMALTEDRMRYEAARSAQWYKLTGSDQNRSPAMPPMAVIKDLLASPAYPLPHLDAVVTSPVFDKHGTLLASPGYHDSGKVYVWLDEEFSMPEVPSRPDRLDLERARELIEVELVSDFPFTGDAERAHAIAVLLLPFARGLIDGPSPMHLLEKPSPGTGATLLAEALTFPALGAWIAPMTEGRDEDEWRKRITASLARSPRVILIDNVARRLEAASLAAVLTVNTWEDRILGRSEVGRYAVRCCWIATGNNPVLSDEIARRTVRIRLDARQDQPWLREGFQHPDLRAWVSDHRGDLCWAACTMIRAWVAEGRPAPADLPVFGMFEDWSRVIGGILQCAGIPGFLGNLAEFYETTDQEGAAIRAFLHQWWDSRGVEIATTTDLLPLAENVDGMPVTSSTDRGRKTQLGRLLGKQRDRRYVLSDSLTVKIDKHGTRHRAGYRLIQC